MGRCIARHAREARLTPLASCLALALALSTRDPRGHTRKAGPGSVLGDGLDGLPDGRRVGVALHEGLDLVADLGVDLRLPEPVE